MTDATTRGGDAMPSETLADFLLARIAEDEVVARVAKVDQWQGSTEIVRLHNLCGTARVLAECDAKRRIVELHSNDEYGHLDYPPLESWGILQLLALPFADHPDYQPEWRV